MGKYHVTVTESQKKGVTKVTSHRVTESQHMTR